MIDNSKEYILCAALRRKEPRKITNGGNPYHEGTNDILNIEIGYRHHDIYQRFDGEVSYSPKDQGFYTSKGRFVNRKDAMEIAYICGQVSKEKAYTLNENGYAVLNTLFSEDLY